MVVKLNYTLAFLVNICLLFRERGVARGKAKHEESHESASRKSLADVPLRAEGAENILEAEAGPKLLLSP